MGPHSPRSAVASHLRFLYPMGEDRTRQQEEGVKRGDTMELTILQVIGLLVTGSVGGHGLLMLLIGWKARSIWEEGDPGGDASIVGGLLILVMALALLIWIF